MKDRIRQVMNWANLSQQDFATYLGISPASLSNIFNGKTNPTNNHVQAIHRSFPEVNVLWILFGEGQMFSSENGSKESNTEETETPLLSGPSSVGQVATETTSLFSEVNQINTNPNPGTPRATAYPSAEIHHAQAPFMRVQENAKNFDIPERKIKEIRVFFDDGTYESFSPSINK